MSVTNKLHAAKPSLLDKHMETIRHAAQASVGIASADAILIQAKEAKAKMTEAIAGAIKSLRADKVKLGASRRTCGFAALYYDALCALDIKPSTATTYLTAFRAAVNDGRAFDLNYSRTQKEKDVKAKAAEATAQVVQLHPAKTSTEGDNVKVHTPDTVNEVRNLDTNNGPDVRNAPSTSLHNQLSQCIQATRAPLQQAFLLLGSLHSKMNQDALSAIMEELSRIESEILDACK